MKLLSTLFFTLFFFFNSSLHAQKKYFEYYLLTNESIKTLDKDSSLFFLEKAIESNIAFPDDLMNLSLKLYNKKHYTKAKKAFLNAVSLGYEIEKDTVFNNIPYRIDYQSSSINSNLKEYMNNNFKKEIEKTRTDFLKNASSEDNQIFEAFLHNEKYFQDLRFLFYDNKVNDTIAFNYIGKYGATPSSYFMLEILKKNKFPDRRKCVRFNGQTITLLLNHAIAGFLNKEDALDFVTLLWPLVENGKITPREYAMAYDHYYQWYVSEGKNYFGTTFYLNDDNKLSIMSLTNPKNVDAIRKKHYLNDLKTECRNYNVALPENYGKE